jgi:hypothetical protein
MHTEHNRYREAIIHDHIQYRNYDVRFVIG